MDIRHTVRSTVWGRHIIKYMHFRAHHIFQTFSDAPLDGAKGRRRGIYFYFFFLKKKKKRLAIRS